MVPNDVPNESTCRCEIVGSVYQTEVDIVAVPAVGTDGMTAWVDNDSQKPWLATDLTEYIPNARVLLFDHGKPRDQDDLDSLGKNLLVQVHRVRQLTSPKRPVLFICHSTGGLVATAALVQASQSVSSLGSTLSSCYGIAFLATPHLGSSYLSTAEYATSIHRLLRLRHVIPPRLRDFLKPRHPRLRQLSNHFKAISSDMKIWSFLETTDSAIGMMDVPQGSVVEVHAPITSTRSGLLDLEHEKEMPLISDHRGAAYFKGQESTTRTSFLLELQSTVDRAVELSAAPEIPLDVEDEVPVQINGFFEHTALGVSDDTPLKLWSTKVSLSEYLKKGASLCLRERIRSNDPLQRGSWDDPSLDELDHQPPFMRGTPVPESDGLPETPSSATDSQSDCASSRSPARRRKSFFPASPRIHITEPTDYVESETEEAGRQKPLEESSLDRLGEKSGSESSSEDSRRPRKNSRKLQSRILRKSKGLLAPSVTNGRLDEIRSELPRPTPRFDRPDPGTEKLLWIHVPYTNTGWVPSVLSKACMDRRASNALHRLANEDNWYSYHSSARHMKPHARFVRPACIHSKQTDTNPTNSAQSLEEPQLALYLPYLHWDSYWNLIQRRKVVDQRLQQGRSKPVPQKISESSLEAKLIWKYLGCEPPIHFRRTLDQFGYSNLRSTVARDDDQMLWKRTRKEVCLDDELGEAEIQDISGLPKSFTDGKVLMVDQLWLWIVDQRTVVTFFPRQEATTSESKLYEQANLHNSIYNELNGDLAQRFETASDLAALIVLHATTGIHRTLHHDLQALRIFEESISILSESLTKSFKRFRSRGFIANPADHNKTPEGKRMTFSEREARDVRTANDNRDDLSALLELRDIMDELGTIMKLLDQQKRTINSMLRYYKGKVYGKGFLEAALARLGVYRSQVLEMKENAHHAQKAVETLLDLKQKQANVDEARMARWQAEVTQNQSRSVMVFTIFTVIFLPLSFFTSLFGVNAREWSGKDTNLSVKTMLVIAGPTSIAIIAFALLMAFSETLRGSVWKTRKIGLGISRDFVVHPLRDSLWARIAQHIPPLVPRDSTLKGRFDRYLGYRRRRGQYLEGDFWTRHRDRTMLPFPTAQDAYEMDHLRRNDSYLEKGSTGRSALHRFI